jgi:hypothetical protein
MKTTRKALRKKRIFKYAEIAAVVLTIVIVASLLIIFYNPTENKPPKAAASDYFVFSNLEALYEAINGTEDIIKMKTISFEMTPVKGNATNLVFNRLTGYTDPLNYYWKILENGTSTAVELQLQTRILATKNGTSFPVKLSIWCDQAEGEVILQVPQENIYVL